MTYYDTKINEILKIKINDEIEINGYNFILQEIDYFDQEFVDDVKETKVEDDEKELALEFMKDFDHKIKHLKLKLKNTNIMMLFRMNTFMTGLDNWCWYLEHDRKISNYDQFINTKYGRSSEITFKEDNKFGYDSGHFDVFRIKYLRKELRGSIEHNLLSDLEMGFVETKDKLVMNLANQIQFFTKKFGDYDISMIDRICMCDKNN